MRDDHKYYRPVGGAPVPRTVFLAQRLQLKGYESLIVPVQFVTVIGTSSAYWADFDEALQILRDQERWEGTPAWAHDVPTFSVEDRALLREFQLFG